MCIKSLDNIQSLLPRSLLLVFRHQLHTEGNVIKNYKDSYKDSFDHTIQEGFNVKGIQN